MMQKNRRRVAPIIALLVIVLGMATILIGQVINSNFSLINPQTASASPQNTAIPSTSTPFNVQNEHNFHRNRNELQVALYHVHTSSNFNGWTAQEHIRAGNLWRDMGDLTRALPHWEAAINIDANANLLRQIAEIYLERGEWSVAWERIQRLLDIAPNDVWALYHGGLILAPSDPTTAFGYLGQVANLNHIYSETAQAVIDAIVDETVNSEVTIRVAAILASAEEWSLAENAYQYAADFYYPFPQATAYVGLMRILQGKNGEAWIAEAIALDENNPDVHYAAGIYWRAAGEFANSEQSLLLAILLQPSNPTFFAELGNTYRAMGNRFEAELWLQTAVLISDNNPTIVQALNNFYEEDSLLVAQPLLQFSEGVVDADDPSVLAANGWAMHLRGDSAGGLVLVNQALAIEADNPRALFDKARILLETNRNNEAIPILEQLVAGDSVFADPAQRLLAEQ